MRLGRMACFILAASVLALDQATKYLARTSLGRFDVIPVTSFFNLVYVENIGSAFGLFRGLGNAFFIILSVAAVAVLGWLAATDRRHGIVYSLILGGAAGNMADRIMHGHVIDFLDVYAGRYHWPAFNVADSALTIGIALLLVSTIREAYHAAGGGDMPPSSG